MGNAYIKFEEYLREGNGDSTGGFSELKAGRIIAKTVFPRGKKTRKNASQNEINKKYWYRYRARSIITGYRYLVATGCLMPEQRGKCKGTSLIHDPHVRHICFDIIARLGQTWSARTFRDKVSADLYSNGMIKEGKKIGRSTATYYLRQLGMLNSPSYLQMAELTISIMHIIVGMVLVHPKKGIYKDGHERPDTVVYRRQYIANLKALKSRERTYTGDDLNTVVTPEHSCNAEVVRVYHDECIYASHEGAIQCWVVDGTDGKYKKP